MQWAVRSDPFKYPSGSLAIMGPNLRSFYSNSTGQAMLAMLAMLICWLPMLQKTTYTD